MNCENCTNYDPNRSVKYKSDCANFMPKKIHSRIDYKATREGDVAKVSISINFPNGRCIETMCQSMSVDAVLFFCRQADAFNAEFRV